MESRQLPRRETHVGLNRGCDSRDGEKLLGLGYILEVKQIGLANGLDMGNEEKKGIEDDI